MAPLLDVSSDTTRPATENDHFTTPVRPYFLSHPHGKEIRGRLEYNNLVRTAKRCFKIPIQNRVRVFSADEFVKRRPPVQADRIESLDLNHETVCRNQNLPTSHKQTDDHDSRYGPYRRTEITSGLLPSRFDYYNKTVGAFIRAQKEQDAELSKMDNVGKFLRCKRHGDSLPRLEAKYAYADSDSENECSDFEDIDEVQAIPLKFERSNIDTSGDLSWLARAQGGSLISHPVTKHKRGIKEWDDLSKILIRQENLDFNSEKVTKKYRGQAVQSKVNSWFTQQEYENIVSQTGKPCRILFPSRDADWTLQKKLYQGKDENHNAVFQSMGANGKARKNYGYDNDLRYWPMNDRGYITKGNIEQDKKFYY